MAQLYIISAPSGAGKSSLINQVLKKNHGSIALSISHTTRAPRAHERDGVHYHFVDKKTFQRMIDNHNFLEYAEVFGNFYGTSLRFIEQCIAQGTDVFLDIDWQGAREIRKKLTAVKSIFILPPSKNELLRRLHGRGQDSDEVIVARMAKASDEISHYDEFDYVVINDDFDRAVCDIEAILRSQRLLVAEQKLSHARLIKKLLEHEGD